MHKSLQTIAWQLAAREQGGSTRPGQEWSLQGSALKGAGGLDVAQKWCDSSALLVRGGMA